MTTTADGLTVAELREGADAALDLAANRAHLILDAAIELAQLLSSHRSNRVVVSTPPARDAIAELVRHTARVSELLALATDATRDADAMSAELDAVAVTR